MFSISSSSSDSHSISLANLLFLFSTLAFPFPFLAGEAVALESVDFLGFLTARAEDAGRPSRVVLASNAALRLPLRSSLAG